MFEIHLPSTGRARGLKFAFATLLCVTILGGTGRASEAATPNDCPVKDTGITLSPGFCATIFADDLGHVRHMTVSPDGAVYVNTWSGRYYHGDAGPDGGYLIALRDSSHNGKADKIERFGDGKAQGSAGGTGIAFYKNAVYAEVNDRIVRYVVRAGELAPSSQPEVVVSGLPLTGDHPMHPFIIDAQGQLFVDLGSASNDCQEKNRVPNSKGDRPCTEKLTRGGTWRYDANKTGQTFSPAERYATGIRNGEGFAIDAAGRLFVTQHGRDQLYQNWPALYKPADGAQLPAEEIVELKKGRDYGWPECYFDGAQKKLVLGPEYGGDGGRKIGLCAKRTPPAAFFPAHWGPNALLIPATATLPKVYRYGAYVAFHGSWNRAPAPQDGYNVVFQPMKNGRASGDYIVFADGFAGDVKEPGRAAFRPMGLAEGPDGALYISDDVHGRIWRVTYQGASDTKLVAAPAPTRDSTAGTLNPGMGRADIASLAVPAGATKEQVALGDRIYHGEVSNGTCAGCHGSDAKGSPLGANLTSGTWLWSDGSLAGITKTITEGVATPKEHSGAMPPLGGSPLSESDVQAVSAYVWAIGHQAVK